MDPPASPISILPGEVLAVICRHCSVRELKSLRLCCKRLTRAPEPQIFETVVLVPHKGSFESLRALSEHARLRHLIQGLIYDPRDVVDELYFCVPSDWPTHQTFPVEANVSQFASVLRSLPQLERVYVQPAGANQNTLGLSAFYSRLSERHGLALQLEARSNYERAVAGIFSALTDSGRVVKNLRIEFVFWQLLSCTNDSQSLMISDETLDHVLSKTICLELRFTGRLNTGNPAIGYCRLGSALSKREHLESLTIQFYQINMFQKFYNSVHGMGPFLLPPHVFGPTSQYSKLKSLSVEAYLTYETPWLAFLLNVTPTLRKLRMRYFGLCDEKALGETPLGNIAAAENIFKSHICLVNLLKRMQSILRLEEIEFSGWLASASRQKWVITDKSAAALVNEDVSLIPKIEAGDSHISQPCLKVRVIDWFINGGICPLEEAAFKVPLPSSELSANTFGQKWVGDSSWSMEL